MTLSTLYLLEEDLAGSPVEPALSAASGEASETSLPLGPGPSVRVREQWPLSSLSSVLLYRSAPGDLRLVFYDEVCAHMREGEGEAGAGVELRWALVVEGAQRSGVSSWGARWVWRSSRQRGQLLWAVEA